MNMQFTKCFDLSIFVLTVAGVWYPRSLDNTRIMHTVNIYRAFSMIFITFGMLSIQFIYFFTVVGEDLQKTVDATALFTFVGYMYKAITVIIHRQRINRLLDIIDYETEDKDHLMRNTAGNISLLSKFYNGGACLTAVMWNFIPFTKATLTLPFYYPDLPPTSPWFIKWYIYQATILIINGVAQTSADHLFGGLMAFGATQLKLLQYKLETIGSRTENTGEVDANMEQEDYDEVISCVVHHLKIIRFVNELTDIFGGAAFGQFLLAAPLLCLSMFIIMTSGDAAEIVTRLLYFGCLSGQLFIYCFCGNMIKTQSDLVAMAAYNSSWTATSVRTQKALQLLMLRGQKTLSVVAGNLFELSLVTFGALLKSSYSFFAVLNKQRNA